MFVVQNTETGAYVSRSGSAHSYTRGLETARVWQSEPEARRDCCGNERVIRVTDLVGKG